MLGSVTADMVGILSLTPTMYVPPTFRPVCYFLYTYLINFGMLQVLLAHPDAVDGQRRISPRQ